MILINSSSRDSVRIFQPFYPIHPPIGIGYLLSAAERQGIKAEFIDEQVEDDVIGRVACYVKKMSYPYIFGFSVMTAGFKSAILASRQLRKRYPDSFIVFGGIHPTAAPQDVLSHDYIDAVIRGEGEIPLFELYRCIKERRDFGYIEGLSYRVDGKIIHNQDRAVIQDINAYPPFPYRLFKHEKYDMGFVMSSRGCPYQCIFCSLRAMAGSAMYRYRSSSAIVDELEMLCHKYNRTQIIFLDDNFLISKKRIYELIDLIKHRGLPKKMSFGYQARGDNVEYNLCKNMYDAGFKVVIFGLETASEEIMKNIKKGETVAQCIQAVKTMKKIGATVGATFIFSLPGETHQDRLDCIRLSKKLQLDVVRYNNAVPYPGTELYEIAKRQNRLNIQGLYENFIAVSGITESPFRKVPFAYVSPGNTEDQIRRDILIGHCSFYFNILKTLKIIMNPAHNTKWFSLGDNILQTFKKIPAMVYLGVLLVCKFIQLVYYALIKKDTALPLRTVLKLM